MPPCNRLASVFFGRRERLTSSHPRQVPAYRVGEFFAPGRASWPEGAQYGFGPLGHELTLFQTKIEPEMVGDVQRGAAEFALILNGPIFFLAYRFGDSIVWSDVPYSWHLQHQELRAVPRCFDGVEDRELLWITLVGANDGVIHAQRGVTLDARFTQALHDAIRNQVQTPFDPLECALAIAEASMSPTAAGRRLGRATAWTQANA